MENIIEIIERRKFLKLEAKRVKIEEEIKLQEEIDLEKTLYDEIIWALTLQREQADQSRDIAKVSWCNLRISEEEERKAEVYHKKQIEWQERKRKETEAYKRLREEERKISCESHNKDNLNSEPIKAESMEEESSMLNKSENIDEIEMEEESSGGSNDICYDEDDEVKEDKVPDDDLKPEPELAKEKENSYFKTFFILVGVFVSVSMLSSYMYF